MPAKRASLESTHYEVGYGKPPVATRFQKGQSGNPSGRPRGRKNLATVLHQALQQKVLVTESGRRRMKSKLEIAVTQFVNKAAAGDLTAVRHLLLIMNAVLAETPAEQMNPDTMLDRMHAQRLFARMAGANTDGSEGEPS